MEVLNHKEETVKSVLDEIVRKGAEEMLQAAIEAEVQSYVERHSNYKNDQGHQEVVRNGYMPQRRLLTGAGAVDIKQPRVLDKRNGERFTSAILPPYLRRTPNINNLLPFLYLKGISTGQMQEALSSLLGEKAKGLSSNTICRLKESWLKDYEDWNTRSLEDKNYVYIWADGIYFNVRHDTNRPCILVLIGALASGEKELIAVHDGHRESKLSWQEVLLDMKKRGLNFSPRLAIGDGALGFWAALEEEFPESKPQRCWVHKTANVLDKMPKSVQGTAKQKLHDIYMAPSKKQALKALEHFNTLYSAKYPKACECLLKDKEPLLSFYDFPAEHWQHIRSTNPIESTFATIRHRTRQTKGCGSRKTTLSMIFKLAIEAQKKWRKIRGYRWIPVMLEGKQFKDGELIKEAA